MIEGSGSRSRRPKNKWIQWIWIRIRVWIRNTGSAIPINLTFASYDSRLQYFDHYLITNQLFTEFMCPYSINVLRLANIDHTRQPTASIRSLFLTNRGRRRVPVAVFRNRKSPKFLGLPDPKLSVQILPFRKNKKNLDFYSFVASFGDCCQCTYFH